MEAKEGDTDEPDAKVDNRRFVSSSHDNMVGKRSEKAYKREITLQSTQLGAQARTLGLGEATLVVF